MGNKKFLGAVMVISLAALLIGCKHEQAESHIQPVVLKKLDLSNKEKKPNKSDYLMSLAFIFQLIFLNFVFLVNHPLGVGYSKNSLFSIIFINLIYIAIISLPLIYKLTAESEREVIEFLSMPSKQDKVTYLVFYDFLSGLALSAFLFGVLLFTNKYIFNNFNVFFSVLYAILFFALSIFIAVISLVRFIHPFLKLNPIPFTITLITSFFITCSLVNIAIAMAGKAA